MISDHSGPMPISIFNHVGEVGEGERMGRRGMRDKLYVSSVTTRVPSCVGRITMASIKPLT